MARGAAGHRGGRDGAGHGLTRRQVLQAGGTVAGAGYLGLAWDIGTASADDALVPPLPGVDADFSFVLRRRADFLRLQLDFVNAVLDGDSGMITRLDGGAPITMVVGFPSQHVHEEALYESDTGAGGSGVDDDALTAATADPNVRTPEDPTGSEGLKLPGAMGSRLARESRLAFTRDIDQVPFTVDALLDWAAWTPRLVPHAVRPGAITRAGSTLAAPEPDHTQLEMPWWMFISPLPDGRWAHARSPVIHQGRTELWHTGLVEGDGDPGTSPVGPSHIRAVWARDVGFGGYQSNPNAPALSYGEGDDLADGVAGVPFRGPLAPADRADIVVSSAVDGANGRPGPGYLARAVDVDLLMLTSMGGYLDATGSWPAGLPTLAGASGTSLESWRHRMSLGRDHYVRVVRKGYLYPFGHRASLIKVTERKFANIAITEGTVPIQRRVAYLFQRYYVVVREPAKVYPAPGQPDGGWENPFTRIRITSLTTPVIDPPQHDYAQPIPDVQALQVFTPTVGGAPFRFHMQGTDRAGRTHSFTAAAPFVLLDLAFDAKPDPGSAEGAMESMEATYVAEDPEGPLRASDLGAQKVFLVDPSVLPDPASPDVAEAPVLQLSWKPVAGGHTQGDPDIDQPAFFPAIDYARLSLESAEALAGGSFTGAGGTPFRYYGQYLATDGFTNGSSPGLPFMTQAADVEAPATIDFAAHGTDRSGASINPGFAPGNINLNTGCSGGTADEVAGSGGQFDPATVFGDIGTLFGNLALSQLLPAKPLDDEEALQITSRIEGDALVTRMTYTSEMLSIPAGAPIFVAGRAPNPAANPLGTDTPAVLTLKVVLSASPGGESTYHVLGEVRDFQIRLFDSPAFIQIVMKSASFEVLPGQKPSFGVELADVFFPDESPLKMVAEIVQAFLSDSPFFIDLQPTSVEVGLDLRLPTITLGALQIKDLGVFLSVRIPFLGEAVLLTFGIGSRDRPVSVTYMALGGGFWVTLLLTADDVIGFELGIEVRASLEGSIGPFKAYAEIAVGIIIAIDESNGGECTLTGYFRAKAGVSLVVVSVKITIEMSLTYIPAQEKAIGKVSVLVEVEVVFFSFSQSFEYERKFGGGSDPVFGDVYPPDDELEPTTSAAFDDYINLFAAVPA